MHRELIHALRVNIHALRVKIHASRINIHALREGRFHTSQKIHASREDLIPR